MLRRMTINDGHYSTTVLAADCWVIDNDHSSHSERERISRWIKDRKFTVRLMKCFSSSSQEHFQLSSNNGARRGKAFSRKWREFLIFNYSVKKKKSWAPNVCIPWSWQVDWRLKYLISLTCERVLSNLTRKWFQLKTEGIAHGWKIN